ncbi:hypothetical protein [Actinoplanes sp. GCM10030250]|uniref:hypothetical protein n=1 Tax=Actinoplanes sp. GCM10030250 TaxID=3273376 RepID=UPI00362195A5
MGALARPFIAEMKAEGLFAHDPLWMRESTSQYVGQIVKIAKCCASTAFVLHMHHCAVAFIDVVTPAGSRGVLSDVSGEETPILCSMNSEPGMHYRRQAVRSSTVEPSGPGTVRVRARKHFCSGVANADVAFSLVGDRARQAVSAAVLNVGSDGFDIGEPFEMLGLRATDSRGVLIDSVVPESTVLPIAGQLPTHLWGIGYAAILHGIGVATTEAIESDRDDLAGDGRWGDREARMFGGLLELQETSAAVLDRATSPTFRSDPRSTLVARAAAERFAVSATQTALRLVGGQAAAMYSGWSRRLRDATTASLLPPTVDRGHLVLGSEGDIRPVDTIVAV